MRTRIALSAIAAAGVMTLVVASPAAAAPFSTGDVTAGDTTWTVYDFVEDETPELSEAVTPGWLGNDDTYDSGLEPIFLLEDAEDISETEDMECAAEGDLSPAGDSTGDMVATCELLPFSSGNGQLEATYELRFFDDSRTVRSRLIVTNDNDVTVTGAYVGFYENYYQDDDTRLGASTTEGDPAASDATVVDGDLQWVIYDNIETEQYEVPVIFTAAGTADSTSPPVIASGAGDGEDHQETLYPLPDLAPGDSVQVVQFTVWNFFEYDVEVEVNPGDTDHDGATDASTETAGAAEPSEERPTVEATNSEGIVKSSFVEPAAEFVPAALAAVTESWGERDRFDTLGARDAAGIGDLDTVVNWFELAEDELAETGSSDLVAPSVVAVLLVLSGLAAVALRRRTV